MGIIGKLFGMGGGEKQSKNMYADQLSSSDIASEAAEKARKKFIAINTTGRQSLMTSFNVKDDAKTIKTTMGGYS